MKTIRSLSMAIAPALAIACLAGEAEAEGGFKVIHSFEGGSGDGAGPYGGIAPAPHGGFYVATVIGGSFNMGTLTLIRKDGTWQVLHSFAGGSDGSAPFGTPFRWPVDGDIYGTTEYGGASDCGTVYKYVPRTGAYQQLYASGCVPDGSHPQDALVDVGGALEATTGDGGPPNDGALIFVRSDGSTGTGCKFSGSDGAYPEASITEANGDSYTTASAGGLYGDGTITEFHGVTCNTSVLHHFAGGSDGEAPNGSLLFYNNAFYGTTINGGETNLGTVFKINTDGSGYTILHTFQGICCGSDGSFPYAGLTLNPNDNMLYGTTVKGGISSDSGTVFKIDPNTGAETVVHSFSGNDGSYPACNLYIRRGTIYGTTEYGGAHGAGTVFKLKT